jgi:hypothetical protein
VIRYRCLGLGTLKTNGSFAPLALMFLDQHREILVADLAGLFLTADIRDVD